MSSAASGLAALAAFPGNLRLPATWSDFFEKQKKDSARKGGSARRRAGSAGPGRAPVGGSPASVDYRTQGFSPGTPASPEGFGARTARSTGGATFQASPIQPHSARPVR
jgi:hypothetical protein